MNSLIVYGLNYRSCPVAIRERFTIPESCLGHALEALKSLPHIVEAAVLSTCNRTEVYAVVSDVAAGFSELEAFFQATRQVADHQELKADFKLLRDDVALHLFRVASGLDSMVLGEGQIMSQVKAAHQAALTAGSAGSMLDGLFKSALSCGKKVRTQTALGRRAVSISSAAVELSRQLLSGFTNKSVLVIGAGRMGQICAKLLLADSESCTVYLANRNESKIKALLASNIRHLDRVQIVQDFADRHKIALNCDAVIVATSAPGYVLEAQELVNLKAAAVSKEQDAKQDTKQSSKQSTKQDSKQDTKPVYVIDMSVPRNVDPQLGNIADIELYNFDHLAEIVKDNLAAREELTKEAEIIVFAALKEFEHWQHSLLVAPVIAQLRGKMENIRQSYLRQRVSSTNEQLDEASRLLVNQILHKPTTKLKSVKDHRNLQQQIETIKSLFDLNPLSESAAIKADVNTK